MNTRFRSVAAMATALLVLAVTASGCHAQVPETPSDVAFGKRVRAYLLAHPEVLQEAFERLQTDQDAQKTAQALAAILSHRQALEHDPRDPVLGNPKGKVTVVEFFDDRCPFCKAAEPDVERLLAADPDVRLVLKEFPILDLEDQTHISENAARYALAANAQGAFGLVHRGLLGQKQLSEEGTAAVLAASHVDAVRARAFATSDATTRYLADTRALAHDLGIDGTPAFVVGDQMIAGAQMDALRSAVAAARKTARR